MRLCIKQTADKIKTLIGYNASTKQTVPIPIKCMRKPTSINGRYCSFISNPIFLTDHKKYRPEIWFHCFRQESILKGKKVLMPESDFQDKIFISAANKQINHDFFYFTFNEVGRGNDYKGFDVFLQSLPIFESLNMKGIIVAYDNTRDWVYPLTTLQRSCLAKHTVIRGVQSQSRVAEIMSSCSFGFFPNKLDCSPRLIAESFIRNRPVVMNKNILGGWHYIERESRFGAFFDPDSIESLSVAIQHASSLEKDQASIWNQSYGFEKSSRRMAGHLIRAGLIQNNVTHVYFKEFQQAFSHM